MPDAVPWDKDTALPTPETTLVPAHDPELVLTVFATPETVEVPEAVAIARVGPNPVTEHVPDAEPMAITIDLATPETLEVPVDDPTDGRVLSVMP